MIDKPNAIPVQPGPVPQVAALYRCADRRCHPADTVVRIGSAVIGGGQFAVIAGPCAVESSAQIWEIARAVRASGAAILRGGAYKPRTSPYDFQGLGSEGLTLLQQAGAAEGLPIVSEITNAAQLPQFENVDMIQVGARNMQNYDLLRALGHTDKPILLKRGPAATLRELLMSAEYIMSGGNQRVILCERGIRTFETDTRNTLDLSAVPKLKELTHLPVIVDPSHATGQAALVTPLALAAVAAGADGLMIEVHNDPAHALCDGRQALLPAQFDALMRKLRRLTEALAVE